MAYRGLGWFQGVHRVAGALLFTSAFTSGAWAAPERHRSEAGARVDGSSGPPPVQDGLPVADGGQDGVALRDDPEVRPRFELAATAGLNYPDNASGVDPGPSAGATLLFRPFAGVGLGVSGDVARFGWYADEHIAATTVQMVLRIYGAFRGSLDGYVQFGAGGTSLDASTRGGCDAEGSGALSLTFGLERYVSKGVRVGGQVGYTGSGSQGCVPVPIGQSSDRSSAGRSVPALTPGLALRAAVTFGAAG